MLRQVLKKVYHSIIPEQIPPCDLETKLVLEHILNPSSNAVDIGCNRGAILQEICRLAPEGSHFAFEPIPNLFNNLRKRFPRVNCYQVALSDWKETTTFNYFPKMDGFSGLQRRELDVDPGPAEKLTIQADQLDNIIPEDILISFIKIDVEGAEYKVLKGSRRILEKDKPIVVFECGKGGLDVYGYNPEDPYDFLVDCGFEIRLLESWSPYIPPLGRQQFADNFYNIGKNYMFVASPKKS